VSANTENPENEPKKRRRATPRQAEAGIANIRAFNESRAGMPNLRSGVNVVIRSGGAELPPLPYSAEIREQVSSLIDDAIVDLGGTEVVTGTQRMVLESSRLALTICALGARYLAEEGVVGRRGKPHGLLSTLASYANVIRLNAEALGFERKGKDARTLEAKLAEIAERESQDQQPDGASTDEVQKEA
jgi:hypothetical protein